MTTRDATFDATESDTLRQRAAVLFPWIPGPLLDVFVAAWVETGDEAQAIGIMRQSDAYETFYPGNRRNDGSVRWSEAQYAAIVESYEDALLANQLNPSVFSAKFGEAIAGNVSPNEFASRIEAARELLQDRLPEVRQLFEADLGAGALSDRAVFAAFLDPDIGLQILQRQVAVAEIGAEGLVRDFDIDVELAERLFRADVNRQSARQLFDQAAEQVPILDRLARRFDTRDRDVDVGEFTEAAAFGDFNQRQRFRQLLAAERALFTPTAGFRRNQLGAITGLRRL